MLLKKKIQLLSSALIATALIASPIVEASSYTVSKGDNLTKIATANKTTVQQLKQWNNLTNDSIFIGQKLTVSKVNQTTSANKQQVTTTKQKAPTPTKALAVTTPTTYKVAKGDTLYKIANALKTSVANIKKWNSLKSDAIYVGQSLKIGEVKNTTSTSQPSQSKDKLPNSTAQKKSTNNINYKVVKGDTLSKIATKLSTTVADIKKANQLKSDLIYIGQVLKINNSSLEGEPDTKLDSKEIIQSDLVIKDKLSKENVNKNNVTASGQAIYTKVLKIAKSLTGTPYVFGGNTPIGFDCSGFVKYVYSNAGFNIARKSSNDYFMKDTTIVESPIPGDIIFFKNTYIEGISHMGIYLGNGEFIHAGSSGVQISKLSYDYWASKFVAFKRFNQVM